MSKKLFVGDLSWKTSEEELRQAFEQYGEITELKIVTDRDTGRSRGFGFITFTNDAEGQTAMQKMDGSTLDGRTLRVNEANERGGGSGGDRGGRGGGRSGGRGGYGGGGRW